MLLCNPRSLGATSDWPLDALPADAAERPTRPGCRQPRRLRASRAFGSSHASQEVFCFLQREKCASRFLYLHFLFAYSISTPKEEGIVRCRTTVSLCLLVMAGVHLAPRKRLSLNCATFPEAHVGNAQEANCEKMRAVQEPVGEKISCGRLFVRRGPCAESVQLRRTWKRHFAGVELALSGGNWIPVWHKCDSVAEELQ